MSEFKISLGFDIEENSKAKIQDIIDEINAKKPEITIKVNTEQALKDISSIDPENKFYYNVPMNNEIALDLNEKSDSDTLENPLNWYNYNNVNNKFVVSEIYADYLTSGITIARNSKL